MADRRPRIGILGIMQDLYDNRSPASPSARRATRRRSPQQLSDVGEFIPSKAIKYREDAERARCASSRTPTWTGSWSSC